MNNFVVAQAEQPGYVRVTDSVSGHARLVYVGGASASFATDRQIVQRPEAPSQKWASVIAA